MTAGLTLDLSKAVKGLELNLEKRGVNPKLIRAQVALNLDVSGSYRDEHEQGQTTDLIARLVPWGVVLDINQAIDVFTFSDGPRHAHHVGVVTPKNVENYVRREIIGKVPGWGGCTDYSYVIDMTLAHFGWGTGTKASQPSPVAKRGFFGGMFGGSRPATPVVEPPVAATKEKALILFNTDGANSDQDRTYGVLKASQDRGDLAYFLFLAYANGGADFSFIQKLADDFSNVGICVIRDIPAFVRLSDDELYGQLIGDEMLAWLKA